MNKNKKKSSVKLGSNFAILIIIIVFVIVLFLTISNYKSQINKAKSHNNSNQNTIIDEPELSYSENKDCITYVRDLEKIDYNVLKQSNFKDNLLLYNTIYEDCQGSACDNKKPLENYYIACLSDISYKSNNKTYSIIDAINNAILTTDSLEKELINKGLSDMIIKEVIEYDTTAPRLVLRDVSIDSGTTYKLDSFIISCTDDSGEDCILSFTNDNMTKYTRVGTHNIEISAKDSSGNETIKSARLIINAKKVVNPVPTPEPEPDPTPDPTPTPDPNPDDQEDQDKPIDNDNQQSNGEN